MTLRPTTRPELRSLAWTWLRRVPRDPTFTRAALLTLAALDAEEAGDHMASAKVSRFLGPTTTATTDKETR